MALRGTEHRAATTPRGPRLGLSLRVWLCGMSSVGAAHPPLQDLRRGLRHAPETPRTLFKLGRGVKLRPLIANMGHPQLDVLLAPEFNDSASPMGGGGGGTPLPWDPGKQEIVQKEMLTWLFLVHKLLDFWVTTPPS